MIESKSLSVHQSGDLCYISFPRLDKTGGVRAVFTTKLGGVSRGRYSTMNMSTSNGDDMRNVIENYRIICSAAGIDPENLVLSHQTHTDNIRIVTAADRGKGIWIERDYNDIDGLITDCPGIALVTQFADCTPLLFFDPVKRIIANVHSGWRGTVKQIGARAVERMQSTFGCQPENIIAAIGPSIGACCYEVDMPVYSEFKHSPGLELSKIFTDRRNGRFMLNLWEANRQILINAGIRQDNIDITDLCTHCHSDVFHSHRATGNERGNLAAIIEMI